MCAHETHPKFGEFVTIQGSLKIWSTLNVFSLPDNNLWYFFLKSICLAQGRFSWKAIWDLRGGKPVSNGNKHKFDNELGDYLEGLPALFGSQNTLHLLSTHPQKMGHLPKNIQYPPIEVCCISCTNLQLLLNFGVFRYLNLPAWNSKYYWKTI